MSHKFSIAAVLGLAAVPLVSQLAASTVPRSDVNQGTAAIEAARSAIEVVRSKPVPIVEVPPKAEIQLAARRKRERMERAKEKSEPTTTEKQDIPSTETGAGGRVDAQQKGSNSTTQVPAEKALPATTDSKAKDAKGDTAQAEPPKPETWTDTEVISALRECVRILAPIAADVEVGQPVKQDQCGAPAPILLRRIGSGANKVEINPPAMINCAMAASLHNWVERTLQPAAQDTLGSPITRLRNASGYACRNRNGSSHSERLSEHALANAIDIAGFVTADGRTIEVARYWGPTARDLREAEKIAASQVKEKANSPSNAEPSKREAEKEAAARKPSGIAFKPGSRRKGDANLLQTAELQKLGRGTTDARLEQKDVPAPLAVDRAESKKSAEAMFLRRLHKGACGVFGTVLGPEANEAHRDHLHFDLAVRRRSAFCE